jgi:hypothetical protein
LSPPSNQGFKGISSLLHRAFDSNHASLRSRVDILAQAQDAIPSFSQSSNHQPHLNSQPQGSREELKQQNVADTNGDGGNTESQPTKTEPDVTYPAAWKPRQGTKEEQVARIPTPSPSDYPTEDEFDAWLDNECENNVISEYRSDLYLTLCCNKWRHWREDLQKWEKIRDWKGYVSALNEKILEAPRSDDPPATPRTTLGLPSKICCQQLPPAALGSPWRSVWLPVTGCWISSRSRTNWQSVTVR